MNSVPVTNQSECEQQERDEQQAGSLRGIDRVAMVLVGVIVFALGLGHGHIVAPGGAKLRLAHG